MWKERSWGKFCGIHANAINSHTVNNVVSVNDGL
jgi:hypothetical protein